MRKIPYSVIVDAAGRIAESYRLLVSDDTRYGDIKDGVCVRNANYIEALLGLEKACVSMRREALSAETDIQSKVALLSKISVPMECSARVTDEGFLYISLPAIIPSKKRSSSVDFIADALYSCLCDLPGIPYTSEKQTVIICHNYRAEIPDSAVRDHDNYETKRIIDTVCRFCMPDDSIKYCDRYFISKPAENPRTELWVLPSAKLSEWLSGRKYDPHGNPLE